MMTDKKASPRKHKLQDKAPAKEKGVLYITVPDVTEPDEMRKYLEENFPDWSKLGRIDRDRLVELMIKSRASPTPVKVALTRKPEGGISIDPGGHGQSMVLSTLKLMDTFGASDIDTVNARASDLIKYLESVGACNDGKYNAALAFVESMAPEDQAQAQLLVQAYITHDAAIRALSQLGGAEWVPTMQTFGNLANKLLNTYTKQMETLMRMQRGNEQVIKHVYIDNRFDNRGGQAIFAAGNVNGGAPAQPPQQPYGASAISSNPSLLGSYAFGIGLSVPGDAREKTLSPSWGTLSGSADGQGERELPARG